MKNFIKNFMLSIPLAIGIAFSLVCISYCANSYNILDEDSIIIIITAIIGFPLTIASLNTLFQKNKDHKNVV